MGVADKGDKQVYKKGRRKSGGRSNRGGFRFSTLSCRKFENKLTMI